nr:movement protein [Erysimum leaf mottle virus]
MSNGLPTCLGRLSPDYTSGSLSSPNPRVNCGLDSLLHHDLPLGRAKATPPPPQLLRNPNVWFGNFPPPPRRSQNHRDISPSCPLVFPGHNSQLGHVHETKQVPQTRSRELQLPRTEELPTPSNRLRSVPSHLARPSHLPNHLHARRSHVLSPLTDTRPVHSTTQSGETLRESRGPPRSHSLRPLTLPEPLHLHHLPADPPLRPRRSRSRKLQPAHGRPVLAQSKPNIPRRPPPQRDYFGILGPRPLPPDSTRPATPGSRSPRSIHSDIVGPISLLPPPSRRSGVVQDSRRSTPPGSDLSEPAHSTSPSPPRRLQLPVHLHSSRQNSKDLRPRGLRPNAFIQTRTRLGHSHRLGQPPNIRTSERAPPPQRGLPSSSEPSRRCTPLPRPTLATTRRHRRSYPLLPNPPSALPTTVFASRQGKVHLSLPSTVPVRAADKKTLLASPGPRRRTVPKRRLHSPLLKDQPLGTQSRAEDPPALATNRPPSVTNPLLPGSESSNLAPRSTFLDPEKLRSALASIPSLPRRLRAFNSLSQAHLLSHPPSATRHLSSAHAPWIVQADVGAESPASFEADSVSSIQSLDLYTPSGALPNSSPLLTFQSNGTSPYCSHTPPSPCSYDYGSFPDTD